MSPVLQSERRCCGRGVQQAYEPLCGEAKLTTPLEAFSASQEGMTLLMLDRLSSRGAGDQQGLELEQPLLGELAGLSDEFDLVFLWCVEQRAVLRQPLPYLVSP